MTKIKTILLIVPILSISLFSNYVVSRTVISPSTTDQQHLNDESAIADDILSHYKKNYYLLNSYEQGHFSLRLYRQTLSPQYENGISIDLYRLANKLNRFANEINSPEKIYLYSQKDLARYKNKKDIRSQYRYEATKNTPEYFYLGLNLIRTMARIDEYGLKDIHDSKLRSILNNYDFKRFVTDKNMIRAWAAQLANQVYWLKQLGEKNYIPDFINTFRKTYPDNKDKNLTRQQYENKLYGLTHIILADSMYYQKSISEANHQWIFNYFRSNIDTIVLRAKADILAEVGISFMLAGQQNDPAVIKIKQAIIKKYNEKEHMILSINGDNNIKTGEHRNILTVMLMNWPSQNTVAPFDRRSKLFSHLPYGLEQK